MKLAALFIFSAVCVNIFVMSETAVAWTYAAVLLFTYILSKLK